MTFYSSHYNLVLNLSKFNALVVAYTYICVAYSTEYLSTNKNAFDI